MKTKKTATTKTAVPVAVTSAVGSDVPDGSETDVRTGAKRWQIWMAVADFEAAALVKTAHGQTSLAQAIRFAIHQQVERDRLEAADLAVAASKRR